MKKENKPTVISIKQDEEEPIAVDVLASEIQAIASGFKKMMSSRLTFEAIAILVHHATPTPKRHGRFYGKSVSLVDVRAVLRGIELLERAYLKQKGGVNDQGNRGR